MRRNLAASLFEHGTVRTTLAKAKQVRPFVEKLITIARAGTLHARRRIIAALGDRAMIDKEDPGELADKSLLQKLFEEIAPRYADRPGGYTRIIHLPERRIGDGSEQVLLQLVEQASPAGKAGDEVPATASRRRKRAARRAEAAKAAAQTPDQPQPDEEPPADERPDQEGASDAQPDQPEADDSEQDQT